MRHTLMWTWLSRYQHSSLQTISTPAWDGNDVEHTERHDDNTVDIAVEFCEVCLLVLRDARGAGTVRSTSVSVRLAPTKFRTKTVDA